MATVNQDNQDPNQQAPAGGPVSISGTAGASASAGQGAGVAAPGAASPVSTQQPQTNQGYTDVGSYLDANQAGSAKMGSDVASNLTNNYDQTKSGIGQSANDVINQVNQGYTKSNSDLISQVAADPMAAAGNADTLSQFQGQLNDTYSGPTSWADQGTQQGNVATAQQYGSLANTPGGLNVYAQQLEGPQASQGVNQLDTMLLGGSPAAMGSIKAASDPYATLTDYLNSQNTGVNNAIGQGQAAAAGASQAALGAFTGANGTLTNLNNQIGNELSTAQTGYDAATGANSALASGINGGTLTPDQVKSLGMTPEQYSALNAAQTRANTSQYMTGHNFGAASDVGTTNLSPFLTQQATAGPSAGTVATPQEYAQMAAIQKLLGGQNPTGNAINPSNSAQAGTYNPSGVSSKFDYAGALAGATGLGDQERKAAQDEANRLTANADLAHAQSQHHGGGFVDTLNSAGNSLLGKNTGPQFSTGSMAHGGEVKSIDEYLDSKKGK